MKTVSMLDLRTRAEEIVEQVRAGQTLVLTYRGRPAVRMSPLKPEAIEEDDPFYGLADLARRRGTSLSNRQIDDIVYGA